VLEITYTEPGLQGDRSAISGAADLAGRLSTDISENFVSGLHGRLSEIKATLV
jgi:hypothetical protein